LRILIDECIDSRIALYIKGHEVRTVTQKGWKGITNGNLLTRAAEEFDILVTVDKSLPFQQHLPSFRIAVILLMSRTNRLPDLISLIPDLLVAIPDSPIGEVTRIPSSS